MADTTLQLDRPRKAVNIVLIFRGAHTNAAQSPQQAKDHVNVGHTGELEAILLACCDCTFAETSFPVRFVLPCTLVCVLPRGRRYFAESLFRMAKRRRKRRKFFREYPRSVEEIRLWAARHGNGV